MVTPDGLVLIIGFGRIHAIGLVIVIEPFGKTKWKKVPSNCLSRTISSAAVQRQFGTSVSSAGLRSIFIYVSCFSTLSLPRDMDSADNTFGGYAILGDNMVRPKNFKETYHPVQQNLKNYQAKVNRTLNKGLLITQGMHMPLRLAMEQKIFSSVGRLPILKSSHLHAEVLNDTLDTITERDYLNPSEFSETLVPSFVIMDKDLKF